jgi:hypothetical protein
MADKKISDLTALSEALASGDLVEIENVSKSAGSKSEKVTIDELDDHLSQTTKALSNKTLESTVIQASGSTYSGVLTQVDGASDDLSYVSIAGKSGGNVLRVYGTGATDSAPSNGFNAFQATVSGGSICYLSTNATTSDLSAYFQVGAVFAGSISHPTSSTTSYNTSSDYRLKADLKQFDGLDKLMKIKMYDFAWKNGEGRALGVIAHELSEVLPTAVTGEKDGEEIQAVDYSKLVPILTKAIQEQQEHIQKLVLRIEELEGK